MQSLKPCFLSFCLFCFLSCAHASCSRIRFKYARVFVCLWSSFILREVTGIWESLVVCALACFHLCILLLNLFSMDGTQICNSCSLIESADISALKLNVAQFWLYNHFWQLTSLKFNSMINMHFKYYFAFLFELFASNVVKMGKKCWNSA